MDRTNRKRSFVATVTAFLLATGGLAAAPPPAEAVRTVPWRFYQMSLPNEAISGYQFQTSMKSWTFQCPAGYTAVSGGLTGGDAPNGIYRLLEYPTPWDGTYHITLRNGSLSGTAISLGAVCVWLDDVGTITTVTAEFPRNANGRAGGILRCPEGSGTSVLSAGVDWSIGDTGKTIDFSSPITDGTNLFTGWYVAGYSPVAGVLGIELRCVDSSLFAGAYVTADDSPTPGPGYGAANATCEPGYRVLTGGAAPAGSKTPGVNQGHNSVSGPLDYRHWPVTGYQYSGVTLRALALCVPASTASVTFTQTPAALSTASSGTITFAVTDVAGETFVDRCYLDGDERGCSSGSPVSYGPLIDGSHSLRVNVTNQSGFNANFYFDWQIDATVPVIANHTPTTGASLSGPHTITFSEPVQGVTTSSVIVHAESANVNIPGTIARPSSSTATWTPKAPLVPGETYRFSFSTAIHDVAGNPLTATFFNVRTLTTLENTAKALQRSWDVDSRTIASGDHYIVSRLAGSRAELTFTATAGQTVSVYGLRLPDGGYADVYLDGVKKATPSFYAATATRSRMYLSEALTAGTHTISIRPLGTKPAASSNAWVSIDNVNVGATVKQETSLQQSFRLVSAASAYGGSYDTMTQATATDPTPARYQLTLVGTGFKVYATKTAASGSARIYVDGVLKSTINLHSASTVYKALVYSTTFALDQKVIRIEAVGTSTGSTSSVNLDRITIN